MQKCLYDMQKRLHYVQVLCCRTPTRQRQEVKTPFLSAAMAREPSGWLMGWGAGTWRGWTPHDTLGVFSVCQACYCAENCCMASHGAKQHGSVERRFLICMLCCCAHQEHICADLGCCSQVTVSTTCQVACCLDIFHAALVQLYQSEAGRNHLLVGCLRASLERNLALRDEGWFFHPYKLGRACMPYTFKISWTLVLVALF